MCSINSLSMARKSFFASGAAGKLSHNVVNQEPRRAHSSTLSESWIRPNWLPGVMPKPSVENEQLPVMMRLSVFSELSVMSVACGITPGTRLISVVFPIQSAHCFANQRVWRRFRKGRSAMESTMPRSSALVLGNTMRHLSSLCRSSRTSPKAKSENKGEAMSSVDCAIRHLRSSSMTRSFPLFLSIFMRSRIQQIFPISHWLVSWYSPPQYVLAHFLVSSGIVAHNGAFPSHWAAGRSLSALSPQSGHS